MTTIENTNSTFNASKIYFIGVDKIINNTLNDVYSDQDISELVKSIEMYGIKQPLSVIKQDESTYRLISGHRRLKALMSIFTKGKSVVFGNKTLINQAPCIFEKTFEDTDDEYLNLISSNVNRKKSEEDMRNVIMKTAEIYERRKDLPDYVGKKRDVIAKMAGVSPRSVDKYLKDSISIKQKQARIMSVSNVKALLDKTINQIELIDMEEYGKTDRTTIKEYIDKLISTCKKKK